MARRRLLVVAALALSSCKTGDSSGGADRDGASNADLGALADGARLDRPAAGETGAAPPPAKPYFKAPSGIAATSRYIVVASGNSSYVGNAMKYEPAWVTIIDRPTRQVVGKLATSQLNTQYLTAQGETVYAVNTGSVVYDQSYLALPSSAGGVDVLDLSGGVPAAVKVNIKLEPSSADKRIGAPGTILVTADGKKAVVGSGTRGDVFILDLAAGKAVRGTDNPVALWSTPDGANGMTVVRPWGSGVIVSNFNKDEICFSTDLAGDLAQRSCGSVGAQADMLEGPIDVARAPDGRALVLMTVANALYRVDVTTSPFQVDSGLASTGQANNRLLVHGGAAYIVNSLSDNLQKVDLGSGSSTLPLATLAKKSNPYDMAITSEKEGEVAWVTLLMSHQVAVIELGTGKQLALID